MITERKLRAAIYARLSTAQIERENDEDSDSIENQVRDLEAMAERMGYDVVGTFADDGISGYKGKYRPHFQRLLVAVTDDEVDIILCRHQDRLERNETEGLLVRISSIQHKVKWQFSSGMLLDPSTAEGEFLAKMLSAVAQLESALKSQRLLMHYEGKRISGTFQAPSGTFGYERENVVEWEAQLIREAYRAIDEGKTLGSIVRRWNADKVPQRRSGKHGWSYAHVKSILTRPRNAGLVSTKEGVIIQVADKDTGEEKPLLGQWVPILRGTNDDEDAGIKLWHRVNNIITDPSRKTSPGFSARWLSSGTARCGICGRKMKSNTVSDKRAGTRYPILKCSRVDKSDGLRHPSARIEHLEPMIRNAVISAFAFGTTDLFHEPGGPDVGAMQMELNQLSQKRAEIREDYRNELISRAEYVADLKATEEPLKVLRERLEAAVASSASASMLVDLRAGLRAEGRAPFERMSELKEELGRRFDALDVEQRRKLVEQLLDIKVHGGRMETNPRKYEIRHTRVLSLNGEDVA
ncbi:recombinase family protein [Microbacterium sp. TWP3-1-2b2]|uniref:recombinase family protein n=1 Tax=Microbacterium sp. TWP3-1-2b2 TaxID=2804651 RepID=UPI003CEC56BA